MFMHILDEICRKTKCMFLIKLKQDKKGWIRFVNKSSVTYLFKNHV